MYCGCRGLFLSFTAKIIRWNGLRSDRPNVITFEEPCQVCGRLWRLEFRAEPVGGGSGPHEAIEEP